MAAPQASIPFTLLLGVLVALTALGMDMFLPAVPVIARELGAAASAGAGAAQITVTTYLLGLALGQFLWGPLSDRHGRRPVLIACPLSVPRSNKLSVFGFSPPVAANAHFILDPIYIPSPGALPLASSLRTTW